MARILSRAVLPFAALVASTLGARGDDGEAPAFAAYTMAPPAGWSAPPIPSPTIFRCVATPACARQIVVIASRRLTTRISDDARLRLLAETLASSDAAHGHPANGLAPVGAIRPGSARGYPALFATYRKDEGAFRERVILFPGRAMVTILSDAPDRDAARRALDTFLAAIVLRPQP